MATPSWEVIHGDCCSLDVLERIRGISAVVTDPPYGVNERTMRKTNGRSNATSSIDFPPVYGDDIYTYQFPEQTPWLNYPKVVLFGANHYASRLPDSPSWLVWDKREGTGPDDNADCEMAWTNIGGPARLFHHLWRGMIKRSERDEARVHPTQKPVELMRWVIRQLDLPRGSLILDPYCGSGSTGVAAIEEGFDFIGVEIEDAYVAIARARIEAAARAPTFDFGTA